MNPLHNSQIWGIHPSHLAPYQKTWDTPIASLPPPRDYNPSAMTWSEYCEETTDELFDLEYAQASGIATMKVQGILMPGATPEQELCYGLYNTLRIKENLAEAAQIPGLKLLAILWNSPGGAVRALEETAAAIQAFPATTATWMDDMCCSAALQLAVAADYTAAAPWSYIGSIGTMWPIADYTAYWEQLGIHWHFATSGPLKGMGDPRNPVSKEQKAHIDNTVATSAAAFKSYVKQRRPAITEDQMQGQAYQAKECPALVDNLIHDTPESFLSWIIKTI